MKVMWTVLVTLASAAGAALAARAVDKAWRTATHEPPPDMPWWTRWFVARPAQAAVTSALRPPQA